MVERMEIDPVLLELSARPRENPPALGPAQNESLAAVDAVKTANQEYSSALLARRQSLIDSLKSLDSLFGDLDLAASIGEEVIDLTVDDEQFLEKSVLIPNGVNTLSVLSKKQLNAEDSPVVQAAERRRLYIERMSHHPFNARERQALKREIIMQNKRRHAYELFNLRGGAPAVELDEGLPDEQYEQNLRGINWHHVLKEVSTSSQHHGSRRTIADCKVQWMGSDHPSLLKTHRAWTEAEDETLTELTANKDVAEGEVNWTQVARQFDSPKRTELQCLQRWQTLFGTRVGLGAETTGRVVRRWTQAEDQELLKLVEQHGTNWNAITLAMSTDRNPGQCSTRWRKVLDPVIQGGKWAPYEIDMLQKAVQIHGEVWSRVHELVPGRTSAACREKWQLVKREFASEGKPGLIKGRWRADETQRLREARNDLQMLGWQDIAAHVGTRTDTQCRQHWLSLVRQGLDTALPTPHADTNADAQGESSKSGETPKFKRGRPRKAKPKGKRKSWAFDSDSGDDLDELDEDEDEDMHSEEEVQAKKVRPKPTPKVRGEKTVAPGEEPTRASTRVMRRSAAAATATISAVIDSERRAKDEVDELA